MRRWLMADVRWLAQAPLLAALLVALASVAGCSPFTSQSTRGATPQAHATPRPRSSSMVVYFKAEGDVIALRSSDHAVLWRDKNIGGGFESPLLAGQTLYVGSDALYSLDPSTGAQRWWTRFDSVVGGLTMFPGASGAALLIVVTGASQDSAGGSVYGVRASDGAVLWRVRTDENAIWSPPLLSGSTVYVTTDRSAYALDARSGRIIWRVTTWSGSGVLMGTAPQLANSILYVGVGDDAIVALRASDGTLLWRYAVDGYRAEPVAVTNGEVFVGDRKGLVTALQAATGGVLWRRAAGVLCGASPLPPSVLYTCSPENRAPNSPFASLMAIDTATGATLWSAYPARQLSDEAALIGGTLYVRSHEYMGFPVVPPGALSALDPQTGATLWSYPSYFGAPGPPAIAA